MTLVTDQLPDIFRCPVQRDPLRAATPPELEALNRAIARGRAADRDGARVAGALDDALAGAEGAAFYALRDGVPILLPAHRITVRDDGPVDADERDAPGPDGPSEALWSYLASIWKDRRPPARPSPQDTALLQELVAGVLAGCAAPRALLLGVTPEIVTMAWPAGTRLFAVDGSAAMIREVWPAGRAGNAAAIRADWSALPFHDAVFDIVVGDASLGFQSYPDTFFGVVGEVRRALRDGGALVTRMYTRPETREPLETIFADLRAGRIGTVEFLWWRLFAALHHERARGADSTAVCDAWKAHVPEPAALAASIGWTPSDLQKMEGLGAAPFNFIFPTLREIREDLAAAFEETACEAPACEDGDRNPTMVFRTRAR